MGAGWVPCLGGPPSAPRSRLPVIFYSSNGIFFPDQKRMGDPCFCALFEKQSVGGAGLGEYYRRWNFFWVPNWRNISLYRCAFGLSLWSLACLIDYSSNIGMSSQAVLLFFSFLLVALLMISFWLLVLHLVTLSLKGSSL